jgi:hypothetical protein
MGNFTASNKPYILFQDNLRTITRIGSKYYSINNFIFNTDWMQIKPEIIGAHQKSTEWDIFESFENAFESLKNNTLSNVGYENNPLLNYLTDKKWAELKLAFIKEGVEGILKVAKKIEWINKSIENLCNYSKDNFELKDDGLNFIDINWYIDKYAENSHGDLRKLLHSNPLLHYLLVGSKAGMSPSPFLDENFYRSKLLNNIQDKIKSFCFIFPINYALTAKGYDQIVHLKNLFTIVLPNLSNRLVAIGMLVGEGGSISPNRCLFSVT